MFRASKPARASRHEHWAMTYIQMVNTLPIDQWTKFEVAFRSKLYAYVPTSHEKKIIYDLVGEFPRLGKLLKKGE